MDLTPETFAKMIDAARAESLRGVQMRGGKRYTPVSIRLDLARRFLGPITIETEVAKWNDDPSAVVVVKAKIMASDGRLLATGHAEERRGSSQVNRTSAVENCETSALGRALAALGLSGGEFASANEMDSVSHAPPLEPHTTRKAPSINDEYQRILDRLEQARGVEELRAIWASEREALNRLKAEKHDLFMKLEQGAKAISDTLREQEYESL